MSPTARRGGRRGRLAVTLTAAGLLVAGGTVLAMRSGTHPAPAASPSASPSAAADGGVLRLLSENTYASLDPSSFVTPAARDVGRLLYRTLMTYGSDGHSLVPDLAAGPGTASTDRRTWTYQLRGGQRYADGTVVVGSDVVRGMRLALAKGSLPPAVVASVTSPTPSTVVVRFTKPFVDADSVVALTGAAPVPAKGVRATGPYQLVTRSRTAFHLTRNPHWTGHEVGPDEVDAELGLDGVTIDRRLVAAAGGDALAVTDKAVLDLVPASRKHVVSGLDGSVLFAALDMRRGAFNDILVRQALEVAFPLAQVRAAAGGDGVGQSATDLLPPGFPGHQDLDVYGRKARKSTGDPVRAKQLLAAAGHRTAVAISVAVPRSAAAVGEVLRTELAPAGFRVTVTAVPDASYYTTVGTAASQADLVLYAWSPDWLTASAVIPQLFTCAALTAKANHNVAQHCDRGFDQQVDIALGTVDDDARNAMWRALDRRLVDEALVVPRSFGISTALVGPGVQDAKPALCFGGMVDLLRVTLT